jgi:4-alpha-glucanotransferase
VQFDTTSDLGVKLTQAHSILDRRRAGILLHITSLPGSPDNGDLGEDAYRFVDFLMDCGVTVWQTLPIGPTHQDGSPYQCLSAHAGNPLLISLDWLHEKGWLPADYLSHVDSVSFSKHRLLCLSRAFESFIRHPHRTHVSAYINFTKEYGWWLNDYALFMALRGYYEQAPWQEWPQPLRDRQPAALREARIRLANDIARVKFEQFVFFQQWKELREYANRKGIRLFGDMPIFVSADSADVWACREYFDLKEDGYARVVAGVPPDYFSATGQRWGNPHYHWQRLESDGFHWWLERFRSLLALYDWVRIDHFRGFEAYWEIPAESETAIDGRWVKAPGDQLLEAAFATLNGSGLPLVAEDLGIITPEVEELRKKFDLPGMLILQFAFDSDEYNPYFPKNHTENSVVYTGTHDNDTTLSWFQNQSEPMREHIVHCVSSFLGQWDIPMPRALVQCALASVARLAILPMQDILELGQGYRMNTPGTVQGNWCWRFSWDQVTEDKKSKLGQLIHSYHRN